MSNYVNPSISTHIPLTTEIPNEENILAVGRPDAPTPSLWQRSVKVRHKVTGKPAIVHRVDWGMNMFRAYYPDQTNAEGEVGRFAERTEWEHCRDWDVEVTYSPKELERQAARQLLAERTAKLDAKSMALVAVLCDAEDPQKNLAKLEALIASGLVKGDVETMAPVLEEMNAPEAKAKRGAK